FIEQLLRHLLPQKAQVSYHRHQAQADRTRGREEHRTRMQATVLPLQPGLHRAVRQIAGGENVWDGNTSFTRGAPGFCQMSLDERAMPAVELAERMQRFDDAGALRPAAPRSGG